MTVKQRAWQTLCDPKYGKPIKICIWRNRDFESPGQQVSLNQKDLRSWNAVFSKSSLTIALQPRFGAVRKLYHLDTKKQVCCLRDIKNGEKYVAVGSEKFKYKKNGYLTCEEKMLLRPTKSATASDKSDGSAHSLLNFMSYTKKLGRTVVYFMVSGRHCQVPVKVVLIKRDLVDFTMILEYLAYRLDISEGIKYLCDIKGRIVQNPSEIKHGQLYIAVPFNCKFVKLDYSKLFTELLPPKPLQESEVKKQKVTKRKRKRSKIDDENKVTKQELSPHGSDTTNSSGTSKSSEEAEIHNGRISFMVKAKCISSKCQDKDCRLYRDEFVSRPASFVYADTLEHITEPKKPTALETAFEIDLAAYEADLRDKVDDCFEEVNMIKDFLDEIVENALVQVQNKGTVNPVFSQLAVGAHEVGTTTSEPPCQVQPFFRFTADICTDNETKESTHIVDAEDFKKKNLTTFADIARQKELEKEAERILNEEVPTYDAVERDDSLDSICKKQVSFLSKVEPVVASEQTEKFSSSTNELSSKKSILKNSRDISSMENPQEVPALVPATNTFVRARDSIYDKSTILRLSYLDAKNNDTSDNKDSSSDKRKDSLEDINQLEHTDPDSKGIQKDWKVDEDVVDKSIQVEAKKESSVESDFGSYLDPEKYYCSGQTLSDIYSNFEQGVDDLNHLNDDPRSNDNKGSVDDLKQLNDDPRRNGNKGSLKRNLNGSSKCRREKCVTFACSDICLEKCLKEEICTKKCQDKN